eukprot:CAMPEP_0183332978 /NCGR_PEP_ID=MMETSP0164_2-20130417/2008_1 /TAXON_ID=221442 /ORGANISM="Coccolithus pelagicus ssp braarudi, Strain PLY182g" /LENGTH=226 /DNA_ID=CAMNT_0025501799 /DNA_START=209 /DNA_END=889 /DNA_ORIENTATION=+
MQSLMLMVMLRGRVSGYPVELSGIFFNEGGKGGEQPPPTAVDLLSKEQLPCPKHRPLPPIDPVEGLSWLDHVRSTPEPCFNELNLGWEEIQDADAPKLVRLIDAGVQRLTLYQNHLGDEAAVMLATALRDSIVHELDLAHNQIGNDGAIALARALPTAPALCALRLNGNKLIGDEALLAFREELAQQPGLALDELWLGSSAVSKESVEQLRATWLSTGREPGALHM